MGVYSWGDNNCGNTLPTVYTSINIYLDFIYGKSSASAQTSTKKSNTWATSGIFLNKYYHLTNFFK